MRSVAVRRIMPTDVDRCTGILARAFSESVTYRALFPTQSRVERDRSIASLKRSAIDAVLRDGEVLAACVDGRAVGVALLLPPARYPFSWRSRWQLARAVVRADWLPSLPAFLRIDAWTRARHPRRPHHYLYFMGVEPTHQGSGIGGALLRSIAARADHDRAPVWLETARDELVRYYGRFGFRVVDDGTIDVGGPLRMRTMVRAAFL